MRSSVRDIISPENYARAKELYATSSNADFSLMLKRSTVSPPTSVVESKVMLVISDGTSGKSVFLDLNSAHFNILENCFFGVGPQPTPAAKVS